MCSIERPRSFRLRRCPSCCCPATTIPWCRTRSITTARWPRSRTFTCSASPMTRPSCSRIAVAHGHYVPVPDRTIRLRPSWLIGDDELRATGADYIALGHWNRASKVGAVAAYYSGSPEYAGTVNVVRLTATGEVAVTRATLDIAREPSAVD